MKKILLLIIFLATLIQGYAQTKGISYQAVILNPNEQQIPGENAQGNMLANSSVVIQFTIIDASSNEEYQEYHAISTDKYGMINLLIGAGTVTSTNNFSDIVWDGTIKKLQVAIDFSGSGSNFTPLSEQNLSYMPQPLNDTTAQLIVDNAVNIFDEQARATVAEQLNATDISTLQTEQTTQNIAIALNTSKTGITPAQAATIAATSGTNTGDQDITGIATNATDIATNATDIGTNAASILLKEDKVNKSINVVTDGASDVKYPSVKAIKTYVDASIITGSPATVTNTTNIATNTTDIASNTTDISTNVTNIAGNTTDITTNATAIGTNANDITANTTDIATNATAIASNASAISGKEDKANKSTDVTLSSNSDVLYPTEKAVKTYVDAIIITGSPATATNTTNIAGNTTDISTNVTNIAGNATDISTLQTEQTTQNIAIALNTSKVGITAQQASDITTNNAKVSDVNHVA
ncbi:MAG: hypothetical protein QM495_05880, partial [Lutibacter sp.]|uniref:hypothetical protein n=1 Tax=Lutibacter sp. TaxID=1925666 RepID=UPI00385BAAE0